MNVPKEIRNSERSRFAILALLESSRLVSDRKLKPEYEKKFSTSSDYILNYFIRIFTENNS